MKGLAWTGKRVRWGSEIKMMSKKWYENVFDFAWALSASVFALN